MGLSSRSDVARGIVDCAARRQSVIVSGARGSGRSSVLAEVVAGLRAPRRWVVRGRDSVPTVPLVPFAALLADLEVDDKTPLTIYTALPRVVAGLEAVVVVDDADLLDQASAVLLVQLCRAGVVAVVTVVDPVSLGRSLRDHVASAGWRHDRLAVLSDAEVQDLAEQVLGAPLVVPSLSALLARGRGSPGLVVELLSGVERPVGPGAVAAGVAVEQFAVTPALRDIAGIDLDALDASARELAELLAVAGSLPATAGTVEDVDAVLAGGLARAAEPGMLELADALVADVILAGVDPYRQRGLAQRGAEALARREGHSRLTRDLWVIAGHPKDPADVAWAARRMLDRGRPRQAVDLLERVDTESLGRPAQLDRLLVRSAARAALGHVEIALVDLDDAIDLTSTETELVDVAERWTLLLGGRASDDEALERRIASVLARLVDPALRARVAAGLARRRAIVGERRGSVDENRHAEAGSDHILAALRGSLGGTHEGPVGAGGGDSDDLDGLLTTLAHYLTLVYDGDLHRAREIAQTHYDRDTQEARPSLGLWTYNRSKMAFHAGQYGLALGLAEQAVRHLAWRDITGQALPADAMLAATLARLGHVDRAAGLVARIDQVDARLPRVAIGLARVEAERLRAIGAADRASGALVEAAESAIEQGELFSGALAIDEAFMICPDAGLADRLTALDGRSRLVDAYAARAVAVLESDPPALALAAARLEELVQPGRAAHTWRLAADLWTDVGRSSEARRALQHAVRIASVWQADPWPHPRTELPALTPRELDVARLAAQRIRSREIAATLGLSVRTVDNHLARAFRKLGIAGRDELAGALDPGDVRT